jgi:hypothetical protein
LQFAVGTLDGTTGCVLFVAQQSEKQLSRRTQQCSRLMARQLSCWYFTTLISAFWQVGVSLTSSVKRADAAPAA